MIKKYYALFGSSLRILDAVILTATWILAYYLRVHYPLGIMSNAIPPFGTYLGYSAFIILLWGSVFSFSNLYSSKRMVRRTVEAYQVLKAHGISLLIFIAMTYLFTTYKLSRGVFLYFGISSAFLLVYSRILIRNWLRALRARGQNVKKVLLAGTGPAAESLYEKLHHHPELGLEVVGLLGDSASKTSSQRLHNLKLLGDFSQALNVIKTHSIDKLLIALSKEEYRFVDVILKALKDEVLDVVLVPDLHEYLVLGCEVEEFDGIPMVNLNDTPMQGVGMISKRFTDIFLSGLAFLVLSPLLALLAILVKLTSKGPIFYRQERMSLNGKKFDMLKFRTMKTDQAGDIALLTKKDDPRVTAIGGILRSTSLDELPQLLNVLLGDMSLVGPRPERTWVVNELRNKIPSYMLKHKVKAGITGWAQVHGWRGDTSLEKRIEFDLYYIRNWSLLLDFKIIFLTVFRGFINKNAY